MAAVAASGVAATDAVATAPALAGPLDRLRAHLDDAIAAVSTGSSRNSRCGWKGRGAGNIGGGMDNSDTTSLGQATAPTVGSAGSEATATGYLTSSRPNGVSLDPVLSCAFGWRRLLEALDDCCGGGPVAPADEAAVSGPSTAGHGSPPQQSDVAPPPASVAAGETLSKPTRQRARPGSDRPRPRHGRIEFQPVPPPVASLTTNSKHPSPWQLVAPRKAHRTGLTAPFASLRGALLSRRWRRGGGDDDDRQSLGQYLDVRVRSSGDGGDLSDLSLSSSDRSAHVAEAAAVDGTAASCPTIADAATDSPSDASTATPLLVHIRYTVYRDESLDREPSAARNAGPAGSNKAAGRAMAGPATGRSCIKVDAAGKAPESSNARSYLMSAASTRSWTEAQKRRHQAMARKGPVSSRSPQAPPCVRRKEYAYI